MVRKGYNKYRAKAVVRDGVRYDSKKEYDRHGVLKLLERVGEVSEVKHHVVFSLDVFDHHICNYESDFTYYDKGVYVVEDVKGMRTEEYKLKKKLMKALYNINIKET
jgi:hypothetical protein